MQPNTSRKSKITKALSALGLAGLLATGTAQAVTITIDNSGGQTFALDPARHFLYTGESTGPGGTKHLDVINTLTNTVVGNFSFTAGGYSSQIAASGTNVFWADQGSSLVRVIAVSNAGTPTAQRNDSLTLATGVAALSGTYAASLQGTGDFMRIINSGTGSTLQNVALGGVAGQVYADPLTNLYFARSTSAFKVITLGGAIVTTIPGLVTAIDASPAHHFVYYSPTGQVLNQLDGGSIASTGRSFDFGAGASMSYVAADAQTGNVWVTLQAQNRVVELDPALNFVQQFTVTGAEAIAIQDGEAFVHQVGTSNVVVLAAPEPASAGLIVGVLGAVGAFRRRRAARAA